MKKFFNLLFGSPQEVVKIEFDDIAGIFDFPKNIRIPNVGEYVWFNRWKQGTVLSISNRMERNLYITTIRVGDATKKSRFNKK
jgi:hypothetical protein